MRGPIYIAGPMLGLPNHNLEAFAAAAEWLRGLGWEVRNPGEVSQGDGEITFEAHCSFLRQDIGWIVECTHMALLPGWQASTGANFELVVARALGLEIMEIHHTAPIANSWASVRYLGGPNMEKLEASLTKRAQRVL